ncbi:MAG: MMPL family transporter, partial [Nitratireductor sp.]|nr:MMPL family transporter [Nitratireductor sp.]
MRRPVLFSLALLIFSVIAATQVLKVRFDGDVTAILPETSEAYQNYFNNRERFRDFSRDITILVESPRLMTASGLEDLRFLQLELAVTENVANATTLFSIPLADPQTGELGQFFPEEITSDAQARDLVRRLLEQYPQAGQLVAPDSNAALLIVTLPDGLPKNQGYSSYMAIKDAALAAAPADFKLRFTGLTPIGATIVSGLITDQLRLTVIGIVLGAAIAFVVFRSLAAAIICAVAPGLTALWTIALFGWLGTPINYLTTVLPTLALIVSYADGIMLYFRWQQENSVSDDPEDNMVRTIKAVGPASSLTSITTLLAFLSFLL